MMNKLTLIISSCDKFSDIWRAQIELLNRNWPSRNFDTLLVTDKFTSKKFSNVEILSIGDDIEFSERIRLALKKVSTEFVLFILDDYFITKKINPSEIFELIDVMEKEILDYVRLYKIPKANNEKLKGHDQLYRLNTSKDYAVNLYPSLWRVSFMLQTIDKPLNAWEYEYTLSKTALQINASCATTKGKEFPFLNGVIKGKFFRKAYNYLKKQQLYDGDRQVLSIVETVKYFIILNFVLLCPLYLRRIIKNVLKKFGCKFYSE